MLGMFWIALELSNPMVVLMTSLSLLVKNFIAFKFGKVAKFGNAAGSGLGFVSRVSNMVWLFAEMGKGFARKSPSTVAFIRAEATPYQDLTMGSTRL